MDAKIRRSTLCQNYWSVKNVRNLVGVKIPRSAITLVVRNAGLSYGQLTLLLLSYIITQADHRLSAVETWVNQHHQTLELATGWKIGNKDATDDRLVQVGRSFSPVLLPMRGRGGDFNGWVIFAKLH